MSDGLAVMSLFREGARAWRSVVGVGAPPVWRGLFSVWWCASDEGIKIDDAFVRVLGDVFDHVLGFEGKKQALVFDACGIVVAFFQIDEVCSLCGCILLERP